MARKDESEWKTRRPKPAIPWWVFGVIAAFVVVLTIRDREILFGTSQKTTTTSSPVVVDASTTSSNETPRGADGSDSAVSELARELEKEKALSKKSPEKKKKVPAAPLRDSAPDSKLKETSLKPMWGLQHRPSSDSVMALGFGYSRREFARFVSTLRRTKYDGDVILATEPEARMKTGVADLLRTEGVLAYGFEYQCVKKKKGRRLLMTPAGCQLTNWYAGGDTRGPRPLALARYEMYRSWLLNYHPTSWGIVFDFRDTFFQRNPFELVLRSKKQPNLHLFAENRKVKRVGNCIFNSGWLRCWGKMTPKRFSNNSVVCSGSTMGSTSALLKYTERMITEFDKMQCHMTPARTESDQGYHNFLYHSGELARLDGVKVTHHEQGTGGLVNTIGAMNGYRVPKEMKGPLDTFWKIRDDEGYLLEYDGQRSAVVHQWDRFYSELVKFVDSLVNDYHSSKS